jgi:16S rRNA (guanine1207-N2)-methyltransferase
MASAPKAAIYGGPPGDLAVGPPDAVQVSPLVPGSSPLEGMTGLDSILVHAPPGSIERRYVLAMALKALAPGGRLTALAAKDKGGARIGKELQAFGSENEETARRHHRIVSCARPASPVGLEDAIAAGRLQIVEATGLWSQPGVFSWDRIDPGSALLAERMPALGGQGADLGCGVGYLAKAVLASPAVTRIHLVDNDRRAVEAARRNLTDPRGVFHWADATATSELSDLDFVVMNPPFHDTGREDRGLGQAFLRRAAALLRPKGVLWLVANRHLPYEAVLAEAFKSVRPVAQTGGYKLFEAVR